MSVLLKVYNCQCKKIYLYLETFIYSREICVSLTLNIVDHFPHYTLLLNVEIDTLRNYLFQST